MMERHLQNPGLIKVCGLTRLEDAEYALTAGADLLGFILVEGARRSITRDDLAQIVDQLSQPHRTVAVFADAPLETILATVHQTKVAAIQLCGTANPEDYRSFPVPILRRVDTSDEGIEEIERWRGVATCFVLERPGALGGTGTPVDLVQAAKMTALGPCLLAGGLCAERVDAAVETAKPFGVDASSGLEKRLREKSRTKVDGYVRTARSALTRILR